MRWRHKLNRVLAVTAGVELQPSYVRGSRRLRRRNRRPIGEDWLPHPGGRLLRSPVFILCSNRSGSTLLRLLLNAHSQIHAPHELHLTALSVQMRFRHAETAMAELGLNEQDLEHLLWDRILHRELELSGKSVLVEKTPNNALAWPRLVRCWPEARFIFLLRHPVAIAQSWHETQSRKHSWRDNLAKVVKMMNRVEEARQSLPGQTVRYEDLTSDPAAETRRLCEFLAVPWEESMLEYGRAAPRQFKAGLGDWREKVRSGRVQPPRRVPPGPTPAELGALCLAWGYDVDHPPPDEN